VAGAHLFDEEAGEFNVPSSDFVAGLSGTVQAMPERAP
jgi:hypothetical protein